MCQKENTSRFILKNLATFILIIFLPESIYPAIPMPNKDGYMTFNIQVADVSELKLFNQLDSIISTNPEISKYKYYKIYFYSASDSSQTTAFKLEPLNITKYEDIIIVMYSYKTPPPNNEDVYITPFRGRYYIIPMRLSVISGIISPPVKNLTFFNKQDGYWESTFKITRTNNNHG